MVEFKISTVSQYPGLGKEEKKQQLKDIEFGKLQLQRKALKYILKEGI